MKRKYLAGEVSLTMREIQDQLPPKECKAYNSYMSRQKGFSYYDYWHEYSLYQAKVLEQFRIRNKKQEKEDKMYARRKLDWEQREQKKQETEAAKEAREKVRVAAKKAKAAGTSTQAVASGMKGTATKPAMTKKAKNDKKSGVKAQRNKAAVLKQEAKAAVKKANKAGKAKAKAARKRKAPSSKTSTTTAETGEQQRKKRKTSSAGTSTFVEPPPDFSGRWTRSRARAHVAQSA